MCNTRRNKCIKKPLTGIRTLDYLTRDHMYPAKLARFYIGSVWVVAACSVNEKKTKQNKTKKKQKQNETKTKQSVNQVAVFVHHSFFIPGTISDIDRK